MIRADGGAVSELPPADDLMALAAGGAVEAGAPAVRCRRGGNRRPKGQEGTGKAASIWAGCVLS